MIVCKGICGAQERYPYNIDFTWEPHPSWPIFPPTPHKYKAKKPENPTTDGTNKARPSARKPTKPLTLKFIKTHDGDKRDREDEDSDGTENHESQSSLAFDR
ncbi:uncharacterized protein N7458_004194 [Penicillium daleae]|uniref:Uncharacterized protein n=1 Tax=Penicillium daleae TaxID=63821 RepID=A0AAD6CCB3_9EURO|nr:uncharacterized protein N7458_004194 [Penicillium daleae]KAJ5455930.1 hypothetical protein N7458_004194 [Penicillium daleae]